MNRALASVGIAAAVICGSATPALAADNLISAEIAYISSGSSQVSSPVTVKGTWSTKKLEVGQTFKVTSDVINWAYDFPFTLNDNTKIGSCKTDKGTLTCAVDNVPDSVATKTDISGIWWTTARLQESVVGKKRGTISIGGRAWPFTFGDKDGDSSCDNDCNGGHYEDAKPENSKWGWVNPDGTTSWMITWIAEGGVKYSVHDGYTKLSTSVKCAKGDTWDPNTTVYITAIPVNDYTIEFTAPEGVKTCVTYTPEPMATPAGAKTATNVATVNGLKLERTIDVKVDGGTNGDGTTPAPAPNPTPSIEHYDPPQSGTNTPAPNPTTTEPVPLEKVPTQKPTTTPTAKAPEAQPSKPTKLAKTGTNAEIAAVLVIVIAAIGAVVYIFSISRKENN
nr:MAG TPA: Serine-rich repeat protein [Caudoviricetes sp.]